MTRTIQFFSLVFLGLLLAAPVSAAGPFGLITGSCCESSGCDCGELDCDCCDSDCCDAESCDSGCCGRLFANSCCAPQRCGTYLSMQAGWSSLDNYTGLQLPPAPAVFLVGEFSDGWSMSNAIGRYVNDSCRAELEFGFRSNTADVWTAGGVEQEWSGHLFTYTVMANLLHDLHRLRVGDVTPYVGGGIGLAMFDGDFFTVNTGRLIEVDEAGFAYQFIAGLSRPLNSNVDLFTEYRYVGATEVNLVDKSTNQVIDQLGAEFDTVLFGIRINR